MKIDRTIAIRDFYGSGKHIYEDQMGFDANTRDEMRSNVTHDIFVYALGTLGYELGFYYLDNETFYFIATIENPIQILTLPRDTNESRFVGWQCQPDAYEHGTVIATYYTVQEIWDNFRIDGKSLEEIIPRSYVLRFC